MNTGVEFFFQKFIDSAMAGNATQSFKLARYNTHTKMCFAGTVVSFVMTTIFMVVTSMEMAFIYDFKPFGCESGREFRFH